MIYEFWKFCLDRIGGFVLFILLIPLIGAISFLIWILDGRPIFFLQKRTGYKGHAFSIIKFRSMTNARDESGNLLSDEKRLKSWGKFLRRFSLDELPQIFNVIRGDIGFIGPRPFIHEYWALYNDDQKLRFNVLPGITGWAQVKGRNAVSWEQKFKLDREYVENRSISLDLRIIVLTIWNVMSGSGISSEGSVTMPRFMGTGSMGQSR